MLTFHNSLTVNFEVKFTTRGSEFHCIAKKVTCKMYRYFKLERYKIQLV